MKLLLASATASTTAGMQELAGAANPAKPSPAAGNVEIGWVVTG
ncbi:hypothetical protein [Pelomonas cellulosilytica]|nr:hypothetical protein [Pelomonas sp. P8]